jgi:hypothetical protein
MTQQQNEQTPVSVNSSYSRRLSPHTSGSKVLSPAINVNSANDMLGEFDVDDLVNHNADSLDNSQLLSVTPNTEHKRIVQQYRKPPVPKQRSSSASSANSPGGVRRSESFGSAQNNNFTSNSSASANARLTLRAQEALKKHQVTKFKSRTSFIVRN